MIEGRVVSLRITLMNITGGWSLVSSSLKYKTMSLCRLYLIDIQLHELDKLLSTQKMTMRISSVFTRY
jgi:hypothetical protein